VSVKEDVSLKRSNKYFIVMRCVHRPFADIWFCSGISTFNRPSRDRRDILDKVLRGSLEGRVRVQRSSFRVRLCRIDRSLAYQILFLCAE